MDYNIDLFPFQYKVNYVVREGDDWVVTREFRTLMRYHGHSRLFMRIYDSKGGLGIVITPEHAIRLAEEYKKQGSAALQTPYVGYQNHWKPLTLIEAYDNDRLPTVVLLKNNHTPEILLIMSVDDFRSLATLFAAELQLNFIKAFTQGDLL